MAEGLRSKALLFFFAVGFELRVWASRPGVYFIHENIHT